MLCLGRDIRTLVDLTTVSSGHVLGSHDLFSCWPGRTRRGATPSYSAPPSCACTYFGQRVKRSGSRVSSSGRRISGLRSRSWIERQHCTHLAPDATVSTPGKDDGMALVIFAFWEPRVIRCLGSGGSGVGLWVQNSTRKQRACRELGAGFTDAGCRAWDFHPR